MIIQRKRRKHMPVLQTFVSGRKKTRRSEFFSAVSHRVPDSISGDPCYLRGVIGDMPNRDLSVRRPQPARQKLKLDSDRTNVCCFFALRTSAALKRDALVFSQALEAIGLNVLKVSEQIFAALIRRDEAETLGIIEPLDCTGL